MFTVGSDRLNKTSIVSKSGVVVVSIHVVTGRAGAAVTTVDESRRYTSRQEWVRQVRG